MPAPPTAFSPSTLVGPSPKPIKGKKKQDEDTPPAVSPSAPLPNAFGGGAFPQYVGQ